MLEFSGEDDGWDMEEEDGVDARSGCVEEGVRETGEEDGLEGEEEEAPSREVLSSLEPLFRLNEALGKREDIGEVRSGYASSKETGGSQRLGDESEGRTGKELARSNTSSEAFREAQTSFEDTGELPGSEHIAQEDMRICRTYLSKEDL